MTLEELLLNLPAPYAVCQNANAPSYRRWGIFDRSKYKFIGVGHTSPQRALEAFLGS